MKLLLRRAALAGALLIGVSSVALADTSTFVTGSGMSGNQQRSSDAYDQAKQQAEDNTRASCDTFATLSNGTGTVTGMTSNTNTYRQANGLYGAVSNARGTCRVSQ